MLKALKHVRSALPLLNPAEVRRSVARPVEIGLVASTGDGYADMEDFLLPPSLPPDVRAARMEYVHRSGDPQGQPKYDLVLYEQGLPCPADAFTFYRMDPALTVEDILKERGDISLPLARWFPGFRRPVVERIIHAVARENAMFAVATGLPGVIPNLLELPWSVGEFASDTTFLTMNQVRMAFLVAAASGKDIGVSKQTAEIGSIVAAAFGWRAIARELAGKIPFGGGLIAKGAIAYAGTFVIGKGLEKFNAVGRGYTRAEYRAAYQSAFERGKAVAQSLVSGLKKQPQAQG